MSAASPPVLAVTTPEVEGYRISRYIGIVAGETIIGKGIGSEVLASHHDLAESQVTEWENEIQKARYSAIVEMSTRAQAWGANAVVGVALDYELMGPQGAIILVTATGTAVVLEPASPK
jgi:uncharacterized protein YbjQ (UPF0145 family)